MDYIRGFFIIISYFTRIPIGVLVNFREESFKKGVHLFPFVGLLISFLLALFLGILNFVGVWDSGPLFPVLVMVLYIFISGGLHIDGLADSVDGFYSGRDREKILVIMSDPHIGSFGMLGILSVYLLNIASLWELVIPEILLFSYVARTNAYLMASLLPYAKEEGMGKMFVDEAHPGVAVLHYIILGGVVLLGFSDYYFGIIVLATICSLLFAVSGAVLSYKKIGGLTGDSMGFIVELSQTGYLLAFHILYHL